MFNRHSSMIVVTLAAIGLLGTAARGKRADTSESTAPSKPTLPAIASIQVQPASLTFADARDARQVLVWGVAADGRRFDLSDDATLVADSTVVRVEPDHFISPQSAGTGSVTITAAGQTAKLAVNVMSADQPAIRFVREVMPTLSKVGCNAGSCHGSLNGKNGFKLSLRGYDPAFDYNALVNELQGRRVDRVQPEASLMLLKPTAAVPHEGRQVILPGSRQYKLIYNWIKEGAHEESLSARATGVEVLPPQIDLDLPGRSQHIIVLAHYADGSAPRCNARSNSDIEQRRRCQA